MQRTTWLKVALVGIAVAVLISSQAFDALVGSISPRLKWAALAVQPLIALGLLVYSFRHAWLIRQRPKVPVSKAFKAVSLAQGLNLLLPARTSELLKATYLRDHAGVPLSAAMSAVVVERTVDVLIIAMVGVLGLLAFVNAIDSRVVVALALAGAAIVGIGVIARDPLLLLFRKFPIGRVASLLERTFAHFSETVRSPVFLQGLGLGLIGWGIAFANIYIFMFIAGDIPVGLTGALLIFLLTTIGAGIPALPGSLGTYEAGAVVALKTLGYSYAEALPLAIVLHATQLVLPFSLSVLIMTRERIGLSSLIADMRASMGDPRL